MRFLVDECLSIDLVAVAREAGHDAQHVAHIGKAGWKDWNVARYANDGDFVLVTNNASDFRRLYAAQPLHAGLVILIPVVGRVLQQRLFNAALNELAILGEPVNRVLEVDLDCRSRARNNPSLRAACPPTHSTPRAASAPGHRPDRRADP